VRPLGDNYLSLFPITKSDGNECYAFLTNRFVTAIDCTDSDLLNNEPALSTRIDEAVKEVAHSTRGTLEQPGIRPRCDCQEHGPR